MSQTIEAYLEGGNVVTTEPPPVTQGKVRCLVTVLDESVEELTAQTEAVMPADKQRRVSELLAAHGEGQLAAEEQQELDGLLAEAHEMDLRKAEARRILNELDARAREKAVP